MNPKYFLSRPNRCLVALLHAFLLIAAGMCLHPLSIHAQGGVPLWTNIHNIGSNAAASAIVIDGSNNVIVTGSQVYDVYGDNQSSTIKYSNAGLPIWTNIYNPFNTFSEPSAMTVDADGNVFVAESTADASHNFSTVIKLSSAGALIWQQVLEVGTIPCVALESNGDMVFTGWASPGFETIRFSNAGAPIWTNFFGGSSRSAIAVDQSGNVFVVGSVYGPPSYIATLAYSSEGSPLWTNLYQGPSPTGASGFSVATDGSGNVFVAGTTVWDGSNYERFVALKYSPSGALLWTNLYGNADESDHVSYLEPFIKVGKIGDAIIAGSYADFSPGGTIGYEILAYSNTGIPLWTNRYGSPSFVGAGVRGIALDGADNVFVAGGTDGHVSGAVYCTTLAYSSGGSPLWTNLYSPGVGNGIAVDSSGDVFVTGESVNPSNNSYVTIKYSSSIPPIALLNSQLLNNQLVLSWTNSGFTLQSARDLSATFTNIPAATSPFTNPITAPQQFFRLKAN
jgi:hypothetical protein